MRANTIRALWREGRPANLGWMTTPDTYLAEHFAHVGFDGIVLDVQHGMGVGPDRACLWLQAVSTGPTMPFIRLAWNDPIHIQYVLDAGAYGLLVPLVRTVEDARAAVDACRYPPLGHRSVGTRVRARLYAGEDYLAHANDEVVCLLMVEDVQSLPYLDEMAAVPGIDGFYVGPTDLALSLSLPAGALDEPPMQDALARVLAVADEHDLVAGIHVGTPLEAARRFREGFRLCPVATDVNLLLSGAGSALDQLREA